MQGGDQTIPFFCSRARWNKCENFCFPNDMKTWCYVSAVFVVSIFHKAMLCPEGWFLNEASCYKEYLNESNYREADKACQDIGAELATVGPSSSPVVLYTIAIESQKSFWMKHFRLSGSANTTSGSSDKCSYVEPLSLKTSSCDELRGYICETLNNTWRPSTVCPRFSRVFSSSCFWMVEEQVWHNESRIVCEGRGGHLADMTVGYKASYAKVMAVLHNVTLWVGNTEQEFKECMRVRKDGPGSAVFEWATAECSGKANVLCEIQPETAPVTGSPTASLRSTESSSTIATGDCPDAGQFRKKTGMNNCYWETSYETRRKTWDEARDFCQRYGGDLASYSGFEEEVFALGAAWGHDRGLWIGLRRYPPNDEFKWSDGTPFEYSRWATGEPKLTSGTKYCVAHSGFRSDWQLSYCGTHRWFICEAPANWHPGITIAPEYERKGAIECASPGGATNRHWLQFDNYCYLIDSSNTYSWETAKLYCEDNGGYLASIHSYEEIDFLLGVVNGQRDFWIGLYTEGLHSEFRWIDGSNLDFVFWDENEEINSNEIHRCVMFSKFSGYWTVEHCNRLLSVVCKKGVSSSISVTPRPSPAVLLGYCPDNWYLFGNNCYKAFGYKVMDKESWSKASKKCLEIGAVLASVHSQAEQDFLTELVLEVGYSAWIGLYAVVRGSVFQWVDNSSLDYTNWNEDEPYHNSMDEDCVEMIYDKENMGRWNDIICSKPKAYICQRPKDVTLTKPGVDPRICKKPSGWRKLGSSCFRVIDNSDKKASWLNAQSYCRKHEAHLATIQNFGTTIFLKRLIADQKKDSSTSAMGSAFWIGAREQEENTYAWLSNNPLTYTNWLRSQPQSLSQHGNCVAVNSEGRWFVTDCKERHSFICEYSSEKNSSTPKNESHLVCPNATVEWINVPGNYCYFFEIHNIQTWNNAMHACFRKGGTLASLHSEAQLNYILPYVQDSRWPLHIGLGRKHDGSFAWVDGSPVDFVNWQEGEPNSDTEYCVEMHSDVLTWNDVYCDTTRGYICSVKKVVGSSKNSTSGGTVHLGTGGIIGIVVCIVILVLVVSVVSYYFCYNRRFHSKCAERLYVKDCL